jgi:hypothetical protein
MAFRFDSKDDTPDFGARRSGRLEIEKKILRLEVPCFEGTLQKVPTESGFPNHVPWPERLRAKRPLLTFDAGRRRELQKIARLATLLLSVNCL